MDNRPKCKILNYKTSKRSFWLDKNFLIVTPKAWPIKGKKIDKLNQKLKIFVIPKSLIREWKYKSLKGRKYLQISDNDLYPDYKKELPKFNNKKTNSEIKRG